MGGGASHTHTPRLTWKAPCPSTAYPVGGGQPAHGAFLSRVALLSQPLPQPTGPSHIRAALSREYSRTQPGGRKGQAPLLVKSERPRPQSPRWEGCLADAERVQAFSAHARPLCGSEREVQAPVCLLSAHLAAAGYLAGRGAGVHFLPVGLPASPRRPRVPLPKDTVAWKPVSSLS